MEWKDYADYRQEDFLTDDYFSEWVLRPNRENNAFWEEWQQLYPSRQPIITEARKIILSLEYTREEMPVESYDRIWSVIADEMESGTPVRKRRWPVTLAAAMVTGIVAMAAFWLLRSKPAPPVYTSQFGENRTLVLPDSSKVILGPHSSLRLGDFKGVREVWLEGEAYFNIQHTAVSAVPFIVHSRSLDIEVLGTTFNVKNYTGNTQVVLSSGKIALRRQDERLIMKPGDLVEYKEKEEKYLRKEVKPERYASWVEGTLVFEDTPLETVAAEVYHQFGIRLVFRDSSLAKEKFSAMLTSADQAVVLAAIKEAFSLELTQGADSTYIFTRK
jgi:transmembrane sensor